MEFIAEIIVVLGIGFFLGRHYTLIKIEDEMREEIFFSEPELRAMLAIAQQSKEEEEEDRDWDSDLKKL